MKKKIYNIFGLRCLLMAVLAAVCGTSWADLTPGGADDPLAAWWDANVSTSGGYVLRTIDDGHTVLDAFNALQTINNEMEDDVHKYSWSDYSFYDFYLAEDVNLSTITNWVPLGTKDNPFQSNFYCYAPTYDCYDEEGTAQEVYPNISECIEGKYTYDGTEYNVKPYYSSSEPGIGYYYDDEQNNVYYSTGGHIGTCKISNMTVSGSYDDGAGFFGTIDGSSNSYKFYGFTFENCSVENTAENGYAGTLYGKCIGSNVPEVQDIFIGTISEKCEVTAEHPGGVYGKNFYEDTNPSTELTSSAVSSYTFDPKITTVYSEENPSGAIDSEGNSINKIYVKINGSGGLISSSTDDGGDYTYVDNSGEEVKYAFGTKKVLL